MSVRALIADDEDLARSRLRRLLRREAGIELAGEARSGEEVVATVLRLQPGALFLDVQMPGVDGFEALRRLPKASRPLVVFVTAFEQHALRAFEVNAVDYLLKPYGVARLHEACLRIAERMADPLRERRRLAAVLDQVTPREAGWLDRLLVPAAGGTEIVRCRDVDWFSAADNYVEIHAGGRSRLLRATLASLEPRLDPGLFARIHRSTLVNLERVRAIHPLFSGDAEVVLVGEQRLRLSRSYRGILEARLRGERQEP